MDIGSFLQSIQDSINHLFHVKSETSATIIISLSIFILGFLFTELIKGLARINKRKITRKIFFQSLDDLAIQIAKQGKSYIKFSESFELRDAEQGGKYAVQRIELYQIVVVKQIGYDNLFTAFFTGFNNAIIKKRCNKKRIKAFNKIWACLENAKIWQEINDSQNKLLIDIFNSVNLKREEALSAYFEYITPKLFNAAKKEDIRNSTLGEYLLKIAKVKYSWEQLSKRTNPSILQNNLVLPIMKIDNEYKMELDEVITSSNILQKANSNYMEMQRIMISLKAMHFQQALSFKHYAKLIMISKNILS